jgi:hypothetical protein
VIYSIFRYETNRIWAHSELDESQPDKVTIKKYFYNHTSVKQQRGTSCFTGLRFMVFNPTFNNISVISWRSVLLVEESGGPRENRGVINLIIILVFKFFLKAKTIISISFLIQCC